MNLSTQCFGVWLFERTDRDDPGMLEFAKTLGTVNGTLICFEPEAFEKLKARMNPPAQLRPAVPTWPEAIAHAAKEGLTWLKAGAPFSAAHILTERSAICMICDEWDPNAWLGTGGCKRCKCSRAKLLLATTECPLKKWSRFGWMTKKTFGGVPLASRGTRQATIPAPDRRGPPPLPKHPTQTQ
jgi:hypothetical protein